MGVSMTGVELMLRLIYYMGGFCPTCGIGTRVRSKKWAVCPKCKRRYERKELPKAKEE